MNCCCSYAGTSVCYHCMNRPSEWSKPVYVINPPFTVDTTDFPPQEFVPIVRCKDCKWWQMVDDYDAKGYGECTRPRSVIKRSTFLNEDWYCADGERREE